MSETPKISPAAEAISEMVTNSINDEKRGQAFRIHMEELVKADFFQIELRIGEWHWSVTAKAERIAEIKALIIDTMKEGFKIADDEYKSGNEPQPGYG